MALSITKQSGTYEINGELNSQTINSIKNYFELLIDQSAYIKLSINKIKGMDSAGVKFISSLYKKAVKKNKAFFIVDLYDKELVQLFKKENIFTY
ncbi:STAS domain-containing protein [uncultured Lutibacter sp.]|uniref:STAS domain-containing protein n=1 Tax=uncultured Lutibacter sp. TaxID=437739 RepID=UPI0026348E8B|nr:STAS domain-containing protein [uncultured Lutibacter sp.]